MRIKRLILVFSYARIFMLGLTFLLGTSAFTQDFEDIPGTIPLQFQRPPASDLLYNGQSITPTDAKKLISQGVDISKLEPDATSDLWANSTPTELDSRLDNIGVQKESENFEFVDFVRAVSGKIDRYVAFNFRFIARKKMANGSYQNFLFLFSKTMHNILLRKGLLRKLGYNVQPVLRLKSFHLSFKGPASRDLFLNGTDGLHRNTMGENNRWLINPIVETSSTIDLQDAIVMPVNPTYYNLELGPLYPQNISNRRILNALEIVYGLTNVQESVNLFSWLAGRIINNYHYFPSDQPYVKATFEDAKWITRRILKLTRQDFEEIVAQGEYPMPVQKLLVEKLISQRNDLRSIYHLEGSDLPFNSKISYGTDLEGGKLLKEYWNGFGSRFSYNDYPSPISGQEIRALIKSKAISTAILELAKKINNEYLGSTNLQDVAVQHQKQLLQENFQHFLKTGEFAETHFGYWSHKMYDTKIIATREVVAGSFMGADNNVQLADNMGVAISGGWQIGTDGVPLSWSLGGQVRSSYSRIYTHLKPIMSIKTALDEKYSNIFVSLLKGDDADILSEITEQNLASMTEEKKIETLRRVIKALKDNMTVGSSLIITDNIGADATVNVGFNFDLQIKAQTQLAKSYVRLSRIHIFRKDDNTFQIYNDFGSISPWTANYNITNRIQVIELNLKKTNGGNTKVKFFSLNLDENNISNNDETIQKNKIEDTVNKIEAFHHVLDTNTFDLIQENQNPYIVENKFNEFWWRFSVLFYDWMGLSLDTEIKMTGPDGSVHKFVKASEGKRSGRDYFSKGLDVLNYLIKKHTERDIVIANTTSGNPGDTVWGSSKSRTVDFESEVSYEIHDMLEPYASVLYSWKGWELSFDDAVNTLKEISNRFGISANPELIIAQTRALQLYTISVLISIYSDGVQYLAWAPDQLMTEIFDKFGKFKSRMVPSPTKPHGFEQYDGGKGEALRDFFKYRQKYLKYKEDLDFVESARYGVKMTSIIEKSLSVDGLIEAVGGVENLYIQSKIQGFRDGKEEGEAYSPIYLKTIGEVSSDQGSGPTKYHQAHSGMTESEFFIYWILKKL